MVWLPDGAKNFEDMFIRFDMIHERDRQTDEHHMTAIATLMHSIAQQKRANFKKELRYDTILKDMRIFNVTIKNWCVVSLVYLTRSEAKRNNEQKKENV